MPTIKRIEGYRFFFYSNEGDPRKAPHVHVRKGGQEAKISLVPRVEVLDNHGFDAKTLRELLLLTEKYRDEFERQWHGYFA